MKKLDLNKKVTIFYILLLAVTAIFFVFNNPKKLQIILLCFGTLILVYVLLLKTRIKMPSLIYISSVIFIFMAQYLGNAMELYFKITHWDKVLHFTSGLILGILGYAIFLNIVPREAREKMSSWCGIIFSFLFGSACAGIWEIYEFTVESSSRTFMPEQQPCRYNVRYNCRNNYSTYHSDYIVGTSK